MADLEGRTRLTQADFERIRTWVRSPFTKLRPDVRADVELLVGHIIAQALHLQHQEQRIEQQQQTLERQRQHYQQEMRGATQTLQALTRALGGSIEIPDALVAALDPRDRLHITDVQTAHGDVKRFSYLPYMPESDLSVH
jgi:response regulator RpfG family c-di-GMP phosphodiesterase